MPLPSFVSGRLLPAALRLLYGSLRISFEAGSDALPETDRGVLFAFWHGKMAAGWLLARSLFAKRGQRAVVSLSKDGAILSEVLERFGYRLIRGSSSRGSETVRTLMKEALRMGELVAITPDGPKGPAGRIKYGTVRIASEGGIPIVFASIGFRHSRQLRSWDHFEIPFPFTRTRVQLTTIKPPPFASEGELRSWTDNLSERLWHG